MSGGSKRGRPKGTSSEVTHDTIVRAARELFAEHGYAGTGNRAIAGASGITTATLYHYFSSKRDIYVTVYRDAERTVSAEYEKALEGCPPGKKAAAAVLGAARRIYREDPSVPTFLAMAPVEMRHHADIAEAISKTPGTTETLLREALGDPGQSKTDATNLVSLFFAMTVGVTLYANPQNPSSYERLLDAMALAGDLEIPES